ncbi:MAG: hypothetical protein ACO1G9_04025 [Bacteroidota bacterium]
MEKSNVFAMIDRKDNLNIKSFLVIWIICFQMCNIVFAQSREAIPLDTNNYKSTFAHYNIQLYKDTVLNDDYYETFSAKRDLIDFRKLRQYRIEKMTLIEMLENEIKKFEHIETHVESLQSDSMLLERFLDMMRGNGDTLAFSQMGTNVEAFSLLARKMNEFNLISFQNKSVSSSEINRLQSTIKFRLKNLRGCAIQLKKLRANLDTQRAAVMHVNDAIDYALAPEYRQQNFREEVSIVFSLLIGVLLFVFFSLIYLRGDKGIGRVLLGGTGLQFISLFVLVIAITLFGILGILGGSELAAILSGISGYVLGKGVTGFGGEVGYSGADNSNPQVK